MKKNTLALFALTAALFFPAQLLAGWTAYLPSHAPDLFFAADKSRGLLFQLTGGNPPGIVSEIPCIHGQAEGDKQKEGDLRTPEGVYFITHKIDQKLDRMEYGPHAFALNYPNPVDRIHGKTGGGIWLHSKGQPIEGIQTRGCLAIDQADICSLLPVLTPGMPILVAEDLGGVPFIPHEDEVKKQADTNPQGSDFLDMIKAAPEQISTLFSGSAEQNLSPFDKDNPAATKAARAHDAEEVLFLSELWIQYWQQGQDALFNLYDNRRFPQGNAEDMAHVRTRMLHDFQHNERIARSEDIRLLEGPDYWVSFFASTSRHDDSWKKGLRVLYWMPDENGFFHIVGDILIRR